MIHLLGKLFYFFNDVWNKSISHYLNHKYNSKIKLLAGEVTFIGVSKIRSLENITAGNNIHIAENAYIAAEGGLNIGDNVHISRNLVLYTHSHNYEGVCLPYDSTFRFREVTIGKNVWIGINVTILPGTHIEEGVIIGAGCVVHGIIKKGSIIGASPSNIIKSRDMLHYEKLEELGKYGGPSGILIK